MYTANTISNSNSNYSNNITKITPADYEDGPRQAFSFFIHAHASIHGWSGSGLRCRKWLGSGGHPPESSWLSPASWWNWLYHGGAYSEWYHIGHVVSGYVQPGGKGKLAKDQYGITIRHWQNINGPGNQVSLIASLKEFDKVRKQ